MELQTKHIELVKGITKKYYNYILERSRDQMWRNHLNSHKLLQHDNSELFKSFILAVQFTGIKDAIAFSYLEDHGGLETIANCEMLKREVSKSECEYIKEFNKINTYCDYNKKHQNCKTQPQVNCAIKKLNCRRGDMNITVISLFLFLEQFYDGKITNLFDAMIEQKDPVDFCLRELRKVKGFGDKILRMHLADLFFPMNPKDKPVLILPPESEDRFVAIDVHLHNFLMRSGILRSLEREHKQGSLCYFEGYCITAICQLAKHIDLKNTLDSSFRTYSPRIVQFLIWLHCSDEGKSDGGGVCNRSNLNCMRCGFSSGEQCEKLSWSN
jgi:hypothetical protein